MKRSILLSFFLLMILLFSCKKRIHDKAGADPDIIKQQPEIEIVVPELEMIPLPVANFRMGSNSGDADETPVHTVIFSNTILMSKYETTNDQVASVYTWGLVNGKIMADAKTVINTEGNQKELIDIDYPGCRLYVDEGVFKVFTGFEKHPCTLISWYGVLVFCNLLSMMEGKTPVYNMAEWSCSWENDGYRLPTEAEWEFAARGGTKSKGFTYSGSNNPDEVAWYSNNAEQGTHPVGEKAPNELGFYDMSGNVWECCWDYYGYYIPRIIEKEAYEGDLLSRLKNPEQTEYIKRIYIQNEYNTGYNLTDKMTNEECRKTWEIFRATGFIMGPQTDPIGIIYRNKRVLRGGDWGSKTFYLRNTYRGRVLAQVSSTGYGFRIVRLGE